VKKQISLGYQWLYDVDTKVEIVRDIINNCHTEPSKEKALKSLKLAAKGIGQKDYTRDVNSAALYEVVLIKRKQVKRKT
jgi:hypothetical protein